ncbi:MAG: kynureninase [Bacteroidota bacterium]
MNFDFNSNAEYAQQQDAIDLLATFKSKFYFPQHKEKNAIYFCGNSLGLQPKSFADTIAIEMNAWRDLAIGGYFGGKNPWLFYHELLTPSLAKIIGANMEEITVTNTLTVNLHLMLMSFYKPTKDRYKILMEAGAFPSDQYAVETILKHFGLDPADALIEISPLGDEKLLHTDSIIATIAENANSIALVLLGGMNYYTGQFYNLEKITQAAHAIGAIAGFDLAHVVGNIPIELHQWKVDFAVWCSYKYLNAGPGAVGGIYVHEKWAGNIDTPRLGGWWGNDEKTRFKMEKGFIAKPNASGWNISTTPVFNMIGLKASLEIFDEAGILAIRKKSIHLTSYLEYLLHQLPQLSFEIITPNAVEERGAQLSLYFKENGRAIHDKMLENGIIVDYREPGVIRVAPAPLYCSFMDVYQFYVTLKEHF